MARDLQENKVSAINQNKKDIFIFGDTGLKIMFVGNSITKHEPSPEGEWYNDCGMAASSVEKDYVHQLLEKCRNEYKEDISYCIVQVANFEWHFDEVDLEELYSEVKDYNPDIMIMFFGANVSKEYDSNPNPSITFGEKYEALRNYLKGENTLVIHSQGYYIRPKLDEEKESVARKYGETFVNLEYTREREETHGMYNHPNDLGMTEIADAFWNAIKSKLNI